MPNNGTSTHWHGIRQYQSNLADGVNGITQCPLAPGHTMTHTFHATQFGTSWYHSHYSNQYGDGLVGTILIDGPASLNYDVDNGVMPVSDWYYTPAFTIGEQTTQALQHGGPGPSPDNILINGTNKNTVNGGGKYAMTTVTKGKKHRLRFINTSLDNAIRVSIDNHTMQLITNDFTPIQPASVTSVLIHIGQRYDVVITATQAVANYWIRAVAENACLSFNAGTGLAVLNYAGVPATTVPTTIAQPVTNPGCAEPAGLTPWVPNNVGSVDAFKSQVTSLNVNVDNNVDSNGQNIVVWGINMTGIMVQWEKPTLSYAMQGDTDYPAVANLLALPNEGVWVYWIIQETQPGVVNLAHPMHLHGHDFYVLGTGQGTFDVNNDPQKLLYVNPPRRDTKILPAGGWLAIAFQTDNPGAWLFHCHIVSPAFSPTLPSTLSLALGLPCDGPRLTERKPVLAHLRRPRRPVLRVPRHPHPPAAGVAVHRRLQRLGLVLRRRRLQAGRFWVVSVAVGLIGSGTRDWRGTGTRSPRLRCCFACRATASVQELAITAGKSERSRMSVNELYTTLKRTERRPFAIARMP